MKVETLFSTKSCYREPLRIEGYRFGSGTKSACIVGGLRGNEIQQVYVCSQLIRELKELERRGAIVKNHEILVVPCVNRFSMNVGKRFWAVDNTDINRMFPGDASGETTQRIADSLFQQVQGYSYGIHFASFYMPGDFVPHVRMMDTGYQTTSLGSLFGLPFVVVRKPRPIDTKTLNYNWQLWNSNAFSVYTNETDCIDETSARQAVTAVLRFLTRTGILHYNCHSGYMASVIQEDNLSTILTDAGGIYRRHKHPGDAVLRGDLMAEILDPCSGEVLSEIRSPTDGVLFFAHKAPLVLQNTVAYRLIRRMRGSS